jgi:hypothetical protein
MQCASKQWRASIAGGVLYFSSDPNCACFHCRHFHLFLDVPSIVSSFIVLNSFRRQSFIEIYLETIRDLLNPAGNAKLRVRERPDESVFVEGLLESYVTSEREVFALLARGEANRSGTVLAGQMSEFRTAKPLTSNLL